MKQILLALFSVLGLFGLGAPYATADIVLSIENQQLSVSNNVQTGTFEIILTHDDPNPIDLTGFQAAVSLVDLTAGSPNGIFTGVSAPVIRPYVLSPNSNAPVGQISNAGSDVQVGDFLLSGFSQVTSDSALASIAFEIDGGVQTGDSYGIIFDSDPNATFLVGSDNSNLLDFTTLNGQFTASAIPEPSSMPLVALLCVATFGLRRRRCFGLLVLR